MKQQLGTFAIIWEKVTTKNIVEKHVLNYLNKYNAAKLGEAYSPSTN